MATRFVEAGSERGRWGGRAGRVRAAPPHLLLVLERARDPAELRQRRAGPRDLGLSSLRFPAGQDWDNPPDPPRTEPYKTHLAYVPERRSDADGEAILAEALAKLRGEI